jgi:hypothetical protein
MVGAKYRCPERTRFNATADLRDDGPAVSAKDSSLSNAPPQGPGS